ncbi:alkyldihydroxyacetonephosphate synthase, peroxisomal-like isoform X2 [Centruroides vittatus]|uniref:alkyldihydroxyacetonephosphate synthase, peroxisomal-like isoform X2 n=1 Tax=Centruroides vittatus TaxID=120091 RepID=UPI00350F86B8
MERMGIQKLRCAFRRWWKIWHVQRRQELSFEDIPPPIINDEFMNDLLSTNISYSLNGSDRHFRCHGHTLEEVYKLHRGCFERIPDIVVWPDNHNEVVQIVKMACRHNAVIIPFGGGTNVTKALECPAAEQRMIISLDTSQMNQILWIDKENLLAHVEVGIIGQDIEHELSKHGLCLGHEPDSYEFSSLGGWIATRASGMKRSLYGNIEDMVQHITMVTPKGIVKKNCQVPRMSTGPDIHQFILGSEGILGVVTEATLKVRPAPECVKYGSIVFPSFGPGVSFLKEVAQKKLLPASLRLIDNEQFQFGQALNTEDGSTLHKMLKSFKKMLLTYVKGYDLKKIAVTTVLLEGSKMNVQLLYSQLNQIARKYGGIAAGEENGKLGYFLTFIIAYLRDEGLKYGVFGESFETSISWDRITDMVQNVKDRVIRDAQFYNMTYMPLVSSRVTQCYETGACVYFYIIFNRGGLENPVEIHKLLEDGARDEILQIGGSLSHHHGVGKIRKKWFANTLTEPGIGILKAIKEYIDPENIFACGNLL